MKRALIILSTLTLIYVGCYTVLSVNGRYVPSDEGLGGVKNYIWAPKGFADTAGRPRLHSFLGFSFAPLWWLDNACVHRDHNLGGR